MSRKDSILASLTLTKCNEFEILTNQVGVLIHAGIVEDTAKAQIDIMAKHPSFWGKIAIMPMFMRVKDVSWASQENSENP